MTYHPLLPVIIGVAAFAVALVFIWRRGIGQLWAYLRRRNSGEGTLVHIFANQAAKDRDERESEPLRRAFRLNKCPDCGGPLTEFLGGPSGILSTNICCSHCWSAFNVAFIDNDVATCKRISNGYWSNTPGWVQKRHPTDTTPLSAGQMDVCPASGQGHNFGPHGPLGMIQCAYCGMAGKP